MSTSYYNPEQFVSDFRQILAEGRKRIGLLLGAGIAQAIRVPAAQGSDGTLGETRPILPMVSELTNLVLKQIDKIDVNQSHSACIRIVRDRLTAQSTATPTIEDILSQVRLLERALGSLEVSGASGHKFGDVAQAICREIGCLVNERLPEGSNPITQLVTWVGGTHREHPVEIFTTNYDFLLEEAFERTSYPYFDGFSGNNEPFFDPVSIAENNLPARWTRLWKLHGSLGWRLVGDERSRRVVHGQGRDATALIYPDHLKYELTSKMPYVALFERLRSFLNSDDSLLVACGFSFLDSHVSAVIKEALAANPRSAVFAFQYRALEDEPFATDLAQSRSNMSVFAYDGGFLRGRAAQWKVKADAKDEWLGIRQTFWGARDGWPAGDGLLLGDFARFSEFLVDIYRKREPLLPQSGNPSQPGSTGEPQTTDPPAQ